MSKRNEEKHLEKLNKLAKPLLEYMASSLTPNQYLTLGEGKWSSVSVKNIDDEKATCFLSSDCIDNHAIVGKLEEFKQRIVSGNLGELCGTLEIDIIIPTKENR